MHRFRQALRSLVTMSRTERHYQFQYLQHLPLQGLKALEDQSALLGLQDQA